MSSSLESLTSLLYEYARLIDSGDLAGVGELLRHARIDVPPDGTVITGEQFAEWLRRSIILYDDGTPSTKHVISNVTADVDDHAGVATTQAYYVVYQGLVGGPISPIVAGRYVDEFERVDGEWRFAARRYGLTDLVGDLSNHLRDARAVTDGV